MEDERLLAGEEDEGIVENTERFETVKHCADQVVQINTSRAAILPTNVLAVLVPAIELLVLHPCRYDSTCTDIP